MALSAAPGCHMPGLRRECHAAAPAGRHEAVHMLLTMVLC